MSQLDSENDEWINQSDAAKEYAIAERTLRRWNLPTKREGTRVLYRRRDIEHMAKSRAAADRNLDQHRETLDRLEEGGYEGDGRPQFHIPGPPHYGGNLIRMLVYSAVENVVWQIQHAIAKQATDEAWPAKYGMDPAALGALLTEIGVIVAASAGGWLAMKYDEHFEEECGYPLDAFASRVVHHRINSLPGDWDMFITGGKELPESLQAWAALGQEVFKRANKRKRARVKKEPAADGNA